MAQQIPETTANYDGARVFERPDGFYWQALAGGEEFGPFPSLVEAMRDMQDSEATADADLESDETLAEAEDEIGIADWIDPETGEPAEDGVPRLEQH
ncbi:hypothetical protein [Azospira restricta]|uniref:Uncharacterized protein n=1 Tax=Azospira restricta TaxID=404405 RepID=A0A974SPB5_9RHOO|nr:hypothetical protein [Azospira restricta]QRJ63972.1 hypothetical protein IWH25_01010 [Azospira restricta]